MSTESEETSNGGGNVPQIGWSSGKDPETSSPGENVEQDQSMADNEPSKSPNHPDDQTSSESTGASRQEENPPVAESEQEQTDPSTDQSEDDGEQASEDTHTSDDKTTQESDETITSSQEESASDEPETDEKTEPEPFELEDLDDDPSEEQLVRAGVIDHPFEQEDSQGVFQTSIDNRKALISYTRNGNYLTLNFLQVPTTLNEDPVETLVKDGLIKQAFEYARGNNLEVIPQSPEVSKRFLQRHPRYRETVKTNSDPRYRSNRGRAGQTSGR